MHIDSGSVIGNLVTAACSVILTFIILNRVAPGIVTEWLKDKWQSERDEIAAERSRALESFKSDLQTVLERYKAGISTLHQARADVIAMLYAKLLEAWRRWEVAAATIERGSGTSGVFNDAISATEAFGSEYFRGRLYLTRSGVTLLSSAQTFLELMRTCVQIQPMPRTELILETYDVMDETLAGLQGQLEDEFRLILGTEDEIK